jgi:hypothetical protein
MRRTARGIGWLVPLGLLAACGQSTPEGVGASTSPVEASQVLSGSYDVGYGEEGVYDAKAGRADVTTDGNRYRIEVTGLGEYQGYHQLFVFDGHRLLAIDPDHSEQPVVYEAPHEHPDVLSFGSGFIYDAGMEPWNHLCGHQPPKPTARGTILGRDAVEYACASQAKGPMAWFDAATGLLLKMGRESVHDLRVNPVLSSDIFSADAPSGVSASVVPAESP